MAEKKSDKKEQTASRPGDKEGGHAQLKLMVSSVVFGYEDLLESIYALLTNFGYEVLMSHKGTIPIDPEISAMESCLRQVEECDLFLGLILPRYGSGIEEGSGYSITHREMIRAIELSKPRWFLVHENVSLARQLLKPYRDAADGDRWKLLPGMDFKKTAVLEDLRILDQFELTMGLHISQVRDRKGNWVQAFSRDEDARLFATAQFRRYRELEEKLRNQLRRDNP